MTAQGYIAKLEAENRELREQVASYKRQLEEARMRALPDPPGLTAEQKLREVEATVDVYLAEMRSRRAAWERESQDAEDEWLRVREEARRAR